MLDKINTKLEAVYSRGGWLCESTLRTSSVFLSYWLVGRSWPQALRSLLPKMLFVSRRVNPAPATCNAAVILSAMLPSQEEFRLVRAPCEALGVPMRGGGGLRAFVTSTFFFQPQRLQADHSQPPSRPEQHRTSPLLLALFLACNPGQDIPSRADRQGPNPHDEPLEVSLDLLWKRGGVVDEELSLTSLDRHMVAGSEGGGLYVLDEARHRVVVLDSLGNVRRLMGGAGRGPGELHKPIALAKLPDGGVGVLDRGKGVVVAWDSQGGRLPKRDLPSSLVVPPVRFGASSDLFVTVTLHRSGFSVRRLVAAAGSTLTTLVEQAPRRLQLGSFPTCNVSVAGEPLLSPSMEWDANDSLVVVSDGIEYTLEIFSSGELSRTLTRNIEPLSVDDRLRTREFGTNINLGECVLPVEELAAGWGIATRAPVVSDLLVSNDGHVWVRRRTRTGTKIDVFSTTSGYLGTLPEWMPTPAAFVNDDRIVSLGTDDLGVPTVSVYRVSWH